MDEPERVEVLLVSPSYFSLLGVQPQLGRIFNAEKDNAPGIAEVVVLSDSLWKRRFGGKRDAIGKKLRIDTDWYEVVGVMPPGFDHPGRALRSGVDMWAPSGYRAAPFQPLERTRGQYPLTGAIAKLKTGVSLAQARRGVDDFARDMRAKYPETYPESAGWTPRITGLHEDLVGQTRTPLVMILAAVAVVLLIACANIAGLMLARSAGRYRELGIRRALGAGRVRLARLLLIESFIIACAGGLAGLLLAVWTRDLILAFAPAGLPRLTEVAFDGRVLFFAAAVSGVTGILFGIVPAWQFSKPDVLGALKDARAASTPSRQSIRSALVIVEVALAMVLLTGAMLLVRSFWRLAEVPAGIDATNVLTARLWLPQPNDPTAGRYFTHASRLPFYEEVLRRARELPGVEAAAVVLNIPLDGQRNFATITIDGRAPESSEEVPSVQGNIVSSDYFSLMRIPVEAGRVFNAADTTAPVAIINQEAARRYFAGQNPVGSRVHLGPPSAQAPWMTIVGVVGNVLSESLEIGPRPMIYRPLTQASSLSMGLVLRSSGDPSSLGVPLSRAVRAVDPDQPTFAVRPMTRGPGRRHRVASLRHPSGWRLRPVGPRACRCRDLRRAGVPGGAANARDRHSHGARREAKRRRAARGRPLAASRLEGSSDRRRRVAAHRAGGLQPRGRPVRRPAVRPVDIRDSRRRVDADGYCCGGGASGPRGACRSDRRPARGLARGR